MATIDPGGASVGTIEDRPLPLGAAAQTSGVPLAVTVTLVHSGTGFAFDYGGDVVHRDGETFIEVPSGLHEVTFSLKSEVGGRAFFLEQPIAWLDAAGEPAAAPAPVSLLRVSGTELVLTDDNRNPGPHEVARSFFLVVLVDGVIFGSDPILIEEPPPQ